MSHGGGGRRVEGEYGERARSGSRWYVRSWMMSRAANVCRRIGLDWGSRSGLGRQLALGANAAGRWRGEARLG